MRHTKKVEGGATAHLTTWTTEELNRVGTWCVPLPVLSGRGTRQTTPHGMEHTNLYCLTMT